MKKTLLLQCILLALTMPLTVAGNETNFDPEINQFEDELGDFYGDDYFVSIATGTKKSIDKAPAIASVITANDMALQGVRNLSEALSLVPGLNVSHSSQLMAPKFNFRGITSTFSPQTLLMVNGIPLSSIVRGDNHIVWGEYPIHSIARIEIIRGPGSALYGADAFAGVINIISKGQEDIEKDTVGLSAGSFSGKSAWLNVGSKLADWELGLSMEYSSSDGHNNKIAIDAQNGLDQLADTLFGLPPVSVAPGQVNVGFQAFDTFLRAKNSGLSINLGLQDRSDVGTGQGVAEALDPHGKFGGQKFLFDLNYSSEQIITDWKVDAQFSYYRSTQEIEKDLHLFPPGTFFGAFPDGLSGNPGWKEDNLKASIKAEYTRIDNHSVTLGAGYSDIDLFEVTETKNFFPDISPRPNGLEDVSDTAEVFLPEVKRYSHFLYVQDIWQLAPDWELTAGLRYDDYSDFGSTVNPRLALVWSSSLQSTTKFLFGRAFRAPSVAELFVVNNPVSLGNPNLAPETIDTFELGYSLKHNVKYRTNINTFYYQIDDFITFVPDPGASTATAQNVGKREGYGIEIETGIDLSEQVSLKANYSYVKATDEILDTDVGDYPNHQLKMLLNWMISKDWNLNVTVNLVGERRRTPFDSRESLDGYSDLAFNLSYINSSSGWQVSLSGRNILDDDIFEPSIGPSTAGGGTNIPFDLPQSGATFYLSVAKDF